MVHYNFNLLKPDFYNINPMDIIYTNVTMYTDDDSVIDEKTLATMTSNDFLTDYSVILFDSEDKKKFNWNLVFQDCVFRNLKKYYSLYFFDELEKITFLYKNILVENVVTYLSPMMIEASNLHIYSSVFRNVKSKTEGGAMFQKYSVDELTTFRDYHFFFYNDNIFENTYAEGGGGAITMTYGSRMQVVNGTITFKNCRSSLIGGALYLLGESHFSLSPLVSSVRF